MNVLLFTMMVIYGAVFIDGGKEYCCEDGECYSMDSPWQSLARPVPEPNCIDSVDYLLLTRSNPDVPFNFSAKDLSLDGSHFDGSKPTVFLIHGWRMSATAEEMFPLGPAYLSSVDANVIFVNYSNVSMNINYLQVVSDIRRVASLVARTVEQFLESKKIVKDKTHLVGMSVGAHCAAYVGKRVSGLARITGLDPAGPMFGENSCALRICKGDAKYVETILTNGNPLWGLGTRRESGDANFRVNGGYDQPGCSGIMDDQTISKLRSGQYSVYEDSGKTAICSHIRALRYYREVLGNGSCTFWGVRAGLFNTWVSRISGGVLTRYFINPLTCKIPTCVSMDLKANIYPARGTFLVATNYKEPYCVFAPFTDQGMRIRTFLYNLFKYMVGNN